MFSNILHNRAWCLLEVFYNTKNQVPFEIYLTEEERQAFQERLSRDPVEVLKSFSRISTRASTCWVINDQNRIHGLIEGSVGFDTMDQVVRDAIAEALKVGEKTDSAVITIINKEKFECSSSDGFPAKIFEREVEISHLRRVVTTITEENSELKSANTLLKIENLKLNAENLRLKG